jgi:hypothetical protein
MIEIRYPFWQSGQSMADSGISVLELGIPGEAGHRFRSIPATHSDARRPPRIDPFMELKATLVKP